MRSADTTMTDRTPPSRSVANLPDNSLEVLVVVLDDRAPAVDSDDSRRSVECTEHEHDPAVLAEMGDGLDAAARPVEIADAVRVDDGELAVVALR